jgi:hypothetical protein
MCGGNEPNNIGTGWKEYTTRLEGYMDRLPGAFGAPEVTKAAVDDPTYTENVLRKLANDGYSLNFITAHAHQLSGSQTDIEHPLYPKLRNLLAWPDNDPPTHADRGTAKYYETRIETLAKLRDTYHPNAKIMITEYSPAWGTPTNAARAVQLYNTVGTALWAADVLGRAARAGADALLYHPLTLHRSRAGGVKSGMLFHNDLSRLYPLYYVYLMFGQWWGDEWVLDVSSTDEARLSVNASVGDGQAYVMLINKTYDKDLSCCVEVRHGGGVSHIPCSAKAHSIVLLNFEVVSGPTIWDLKKLFGELRTQAALTDTLAGELRGQADALSGEAKDLYKRVEVLDTALGDLSGPPP